MKTLSITVLVVLLSLSLTHARVLQIPIEEMPSKADFVIVGKVLDKDCRWDERGLMIYTDYVIAVEEEILGKPDSIIVMSFSGGTVNGESIFTTDTPQFEVEKTYLLFGLANEKSFAPVVGHEQGVFNVLNDKASGKEYIVDYFGNLLEKLDSGKVIRGRPVDTKAVDRLVFVEQKREKKAPVPKPVVRDYKGNVIPQPEGASAAKEVRQSGQPLEKGAFINYIKGQAKK